MAAKEHYDSLGGRDALLAAMHRVLDDLRRFPYFGFVPEKDRSQAISRLEKAIRFLETHPMMDVLSTRTLFPEVVDKQAKTLRVFLQKERFQFIHNILFADYHATREKLYEATGMQYPEVLMDLRAAYNVRFHQWFDHHENKE